MKNTSKKTHHDTAIRLRNAALDSIAREGHKSTKALSGDLDYFWAWSAEVYGNVEAYPIESEAFELFAEHHLEGLPLPVDSALVDKKVKAKLGTHSQLTVRRRLYSLSRVMRALGYEGELDEGGYKAAWSRCDKRKVSGRRIKRKEFSDQILKEFLEYCQVNPNATYTQRLLALRDQAILQLGYVLGARKGAFLKLTADQLIEGESEEWSVKLPEMNKVVALPQPVAAALSGWLSATKITEGNVFRGVYPNGELTKSYDVKCFNRRIKKIAKAVGYDPDAFSALSFGQGTVVSRINILSYKEQIRDMRHQLSKTTGTTEIISAYEEANRKLVEQMNDLQDRYNQLQADYDALVSQRDRST